MRHTFLTRLLLTLTFLVGFSPAVWADEHNEAARYAGFEALPAAQNGDVVFIGNSITHMMNWWEALGNRHNVHGRGNSGAKTYQALANLESMIAGQPSKAFVMLGTNDFGNDDSVEHVVHLVKTLLKRIRLESPRTTVYCQGILPSGYGNPRLTRITPANELLKAWIEEQNDEKLVYVDINSFFNDGAGNIKNRTNDRATSWSYDNLHLTPLGYRVWMNEIEQYLDGAECVIPDNADLKNLHGDQQTSWGARIATFGTMPVTGNDILMFGDDFIHYGEWHELIGSTDFKDRGNGWQFFSTNIGGVQAALEPALSKTQYNVTNCGVQRATPRAVCLNVGGRNIMDGNDDSAIQQAYLGLVNAARAQVDASTPIFLMSIMPLDNAAKNEKVKTLNAYMQTLASDMEYVYYVDLYGAMTTGDAQTAKYFHANRNWALNGGVTIHPYPTPLGYVKAANVLCDKLNSVLGTTYRPISEEQAQQNITRFANRSIVGNAVTDVYNKLYNVGDAPGQYSASNVEEAETLIAEACKVLWNTDVTADQANAAIAPLQAMTFTVNLPKTSDETHQYYYTISDARSSKFITAASGSSSLTAEATASGTANQQWKLTPNANGGYNIQNVLTGGFLTTTSPITTSATAPAKGWMLGAVDGCFIITNGEAQINHNPNNNTVYNWGYGTKEAGEYRTDDAGCLFRFVLAEEIVPPVVPAGPALDFPAGSGLNNLLPRPQKVTLGSGTYTGSIESAKVEKITAEDLTALGAYDYEVAGFDNEGYQLIITTSGITIKAATDFGVIRAKQTLAQMEQGGTFECCEIVDWPAFKVRGFMHDVGRSFISYEELKKEIDLLAKFKVNMFHWHLTDYHAFRFESKLHPDVNNKAFERFVGKYYSQEECKALDAYARERGVVIIPEIDMPGHSRQFKNATGYDMNSAEGKRILKDILGEVAECFPNAPYIHVGADETSVTVQYVKEMTDCIHAKGKKTVCWQTYGGGDVTPTSMGIDMLTNWATRGHLVSGVPNIDMRYFYVNHFDVFADLEGAYRSLIFDAEKGNPNIGGVSIGIWNDRYLSDEKQIVAQNNIYAAALAMSERAWCGGTYKDNHHQYIERGRAYLPNEGWEYEEFADWERRFLLYKNTWLSDVAENIPYVKQTNIRWNITKGYDNGGDKTRSFDPETTDELTVEPGSTFATGAGVWLNHIWAGTVNGVFPSSQSYNQTRYAWTYVYSPTAQTVGAQIEFRNYSRSDAGLVPRNGEWDIMGSRVWVNGKEYNPTWEWSNAGVNPSAESDLGNLNFPGRKPIEVQLQQGWNKVLLKLPYINIGNGGGNRPNKWQYTFVFTDTDGKNAVDGLVYSPTKSTNGIENFTVPSAPRITPTASTSTETHWYTIKSKRDNRLVTNSENMVSATAAADNTYWKFVDRGDNTYDIISYTDGRYISPVANNNARLSCTTERPSAGWSLGAGQTDGYFLIYSGSTQFNQTGSAHSYELYNWGYGSQTTGQYRADDDGCQFIFTEIQGLTVPSTPAGDNVFYTITNHQKNKTTYALYINDGELTIGEADKEASSYGDKALFVKEAKGDKWAFRNKDSGEYLVFRGKGYGTNDDKGVVNAYNTNYCDFTITSCTTHVTDGVLLTGKRSNGNNGTLVLKNDGTFDAWSDPTECWNDTYSNIFTLEEVRIAVPTIDYIIDKDHGNLYNTNGSANQGWNATWKSTQQPELKLIAYDNAMTEANNMTWNGTTVQLESGQRRPGNYAIVAPEGYVIESYSFDMTANTATSNTLTIAGTSYTTSQTAQTIAATGVGEQTVSFTLDGANATGTLLTNFVVKIRPISGDIPVVDTTPRTVSVTYRVEGATTFAKNNYRLGELNIAAGSTVVAIPEVTDADQTFEYTVNPGRTITISEKMHYHGWNTPVVERSETDTLSFTVTYTPDLDDESQYLWYTTKDDHPYRIPAIAKMSNGELLAVMDYRTCGDDIGMGEVDLVGRIGTPDGKQWTDDFMIADGDGNSTTYPYFGCGYGDAAVVADRESGKVVIMCVSGKVRYNWASATSHPCVARIESNDFGRTWTIHNVTDQFLGQSTSLLPGSYALFFGSGRIVQSKQVKVDGSSYYRLYASIVSRGSNCNGNYVVYSDNFGETWQILGTDDSYTSCAPSGNEPKVEELPNGDIMLSSRKGGGRYFNVFNFSDFANNKTAGTWGAQTNSTGITAADCNGEIIILDAYKTYDGTKTKVLLQSVPCSGSRRDVGIYYKEIDADHVYTAAEIATGWTKGMAVSTVESAYSTMVEQADGRLAFLFEEAPTWKNTFGYAEVYRPISIFEATDGAFQLEPVVAPTKDAYLSYFNTDEERAAGHLSWVGIRNVRNNTYTAYVASASATTVGSHPNGAKADTDLFALVGTPDDFKIYSKVYGTADGKALGYANSNRDTAVVPGGNSSFRLVAHNSEGTFLIVPTGNEAQSWNMHGGAGNAIKFYDSTDGGANWKLDLVSLFGDVNRNGRADAADVEALGAGILGLDESANADINGNGVVTIDDITVLVQHLTGAGCRR